MVSTIQIISHSKCIKEERMSMYRQGFATVKLPL